MFEIGDKVEIHAKDYENKIETLSKTAIGTIVKMINNNKYKYVVHVNNKNDLDTRMLFYLNYDNTILLSENEIRQLILTPRDKIKNELLGEIQ